MSRDRWLVHIEHGEYSDWCYDPIGIFDTEEEAREFASRIRIRFRRRGWLVDGFPPSADDALVPFVQQDDGTYICGVGNEECGLFITRFEGGIGIFPSFVEVDA